MTQKAEYITKMEKQLEKLNLKMTELAAEAQAAKEEAREIHKEKVTKLNQQSKIAAAKLEELKSANEDSWGTIRAIAPTSHSSNQ